MSDFDRIEEARERNEGLHYEEYHERWGGSSDDPEPLCPICGALCRSEIVTGKSSLEPGRRNWRCDVHGPVVPEWTHEEEEEEP